ncbi:MAG: hypothetical protein AAGC96_16055 [Pseudomonadota bacterium]
MDRAAGGPAVMVKRNPSMAAALCLILSWPALATDDNNTEITPCLDAVGTYLTNRIIEVDGTNDIVMRSLVSLTNGGHIMFTNVLEGGVLSYQPFSDGHGSWRCDGNTDGTVNLTALLLDFVNPSEDDPKAKIARLDVQASIEVATGALSGEATIRFVPLIGDPFDQSSLTDPIKYAFTGEKVVLDN